jgi:hypothetical protein
MDNTANLIKNDKGKYFHEGKCYEEHLEHRKFIDEENKKLDSLYQYIKELHGLIQVPPRVMHRIQELRNGNDIRNGKSEKKYRQGVSYDLLLAAYKLKEKDIHWFIQNVLKGNKEAKDVNAALTIALNSLSEAWRMEQANKKREEEREQIRNELKSEEPEKTYVYNKKNTNDISEFM